MTNDPAAADTYISLANRLLPVVAAALVDADGRVLLQRRPPGKSLAGLWEFPGGKIDPGEDPETALVRELDEELDILVAKEAVTPAVFASAPLGDRHLVLLLYVIRDWQRMPRPVEATELCWVLPTAMDADSMPPADRPLVDLLRTILAR